MIKEVKTVANFICDICGGNIKMQGSQGGVCQNCGMEYDIEAIRAKVNAAPQPKVETPVVAQPAPQRTQQEEIDRQALLIYLNDLRTMETILYESEEKKNDLDDNADSFKREIGRITEEKNEVDNSISKCDKSIKYGFYSEERHKTNKLVMCWSAGISFVLFIMGIFMISHQEQHNTSSSDNSFIAFVMVLAVLSALFFVAFLELDIKQKKEYVSQLKEKRDELNKKKEAKSNEQKKMENDLLEWDKVSDEIKTEIVSEEQYTRELLKKAYSANIIPLQFRTIEGVYYLYDYLSTSNQSLAEALMQANLEAIKQKLEQMIDTQAEMLIEQQQTNAKLANIQQTNQKILENAKRTAINTAQAAKYAQIAATNTELLTKLNKKQLAYQRADFWLK